MIRGSVAAWIGRGVLAAIFGIYALYAWYLMNNLPIFPMETAYADGQGGVLFSTIRRSWELAVGGGVIAVRSLSVFCALAAIGLTYRIGVILSHDQVSGAFLALAYVLFPPLAGVFSLATPHALTTALSLLAVVLVLEPQVRFGLLGRIVGAISLVVIGAAIGTNNISEDDLAGAGQNTVLSAALLPYAMLWVSALTGLFLSGRASLRLRLGSPGIWIVRAAPLAAATFLVGLVLIGRWQAGQLLSAAGYVFGLCVLGALPLVMWVRFVMPEVRAVLAWLAFPVIMYSGFWVVLGPISGESFPYSEVGPEDGHSIGQSGPRFEPDQSH
jgi:hypothetical protein